jgi:uncharacterized protein YwqG
MEPNEIRKRLAQAGLNRISDMVVELSKPCVKLITTPMDEEDLKKGATKIGGLPDMPDSMDWPKNNDFPLSFVAQINLSEVAGVLRTELLPKTGWLYFFYDTEEFPWGFSPEDKGGWRTLYFDGSVDDLKQREHPEEMEELEPFIPCAVEMVSALSLPSEITLSESHMELLEEESDAYIDFMDDLDEEQEIETGDHQLLGHPLEVQGEMTFECEAVSKGIYMGGPEGFKRADTETIRQGARNWRLLLQVGSDDEAGMMWGDLGYLYFWIREQDLLAKDFDKVWMILQCS